MQFKFALGFATLIVCIASPITETATKVMFLGDSITGGPGCWRALLWNQFKDAGKTSVDFVGTLPATNCGVAYDGDNEGHSGYFATDIANQNQLPPWLAATKPDIVVMILGTNDLWHKNLSSSTVTTAFSKLVDQMRVSKLTMRIFVSQITPLAPSDCSECPQRVVNLNDAIPAWADSRSTILSPITVVDLWTGCNTETDTYDGVHPTDSGDNKIANKFYSSLVKVL